MIEVGWIGSAALAWIATLGWLVAKSLDSDVEDVEDLDRARTLTVEDRRTPPRYGETEVVAVPVDDEVRFLVFPDGTQNPETIDRRALSTEGSA